MTKFIHKQKMFVLTMLESLRPTKILSIEAKSKPQVNNEEEPSKGQLRSGGNRIQPKTADNALNVAQRVVSMSSSAMISEVSQLEVMDMYDP